MNKLFIIIIAVFSLSGVGFFVFKKFYRQVNTEIMMIHPDPSPIKIKPLDNSNYEFSGDLENTVYDNFKSQKFSPRKINLLPEPEQPIDIGFHKISENNINKDNHNIDSLDLILAEIMDTNNDNKIDISSIDNILPDDFWQTDKQSQRNIKKEEIEVISTFNNENYKNLKVTKVVENNKLNDNHTSKTNNSFKIQLASVKSENLGKIEGERIRKKFPKILGNLNIIVQKIKLEKNKFFFLVFAEPFANISKAKAACKKLASKGQTCIIGH